MLRSLLFALLLAPSLAFAGSVDLTWTNATKNTDDTDIPATGPGSLVNTRLEYGSCGPSNAFGTKQGEIVVAAPANSARVSDLVPQVFCFRALHRNTFGLESVFSNVVVRTVSPPTPAPPSNLIATNLTVYTVIKRVDRFVMLPVGTVPANTTCDSTQQVNGYFAVPRAKVQWSGNVQPDVVVAQCS